MSTSKIFWTLVLVASAASKEVGVPERFLRPRNYNPHPFIATHGGGPEIDNSPRLPEEHPYHLFQRVNVRGEDDNSPIQFPKVPEVAKPTKSKTPGYITVPKNYAFSYAVKDKQSGDDFSHSQAHNGQATQGEYRVKLPDGRVQVVSYTADSTGYRADVRYDKDNTLVIRKHSPPSDNLLYSQQPQVYNSPSNNLLYTNPYEEQYTPDVTYNVPTLHHQKHNYVQSLIQVTTPQPQENLFVPKLENYNLEQPRYRSQPLSAAEYTSPESNYYQPEYQQIQQKYYTQIPTNQRVYQQPRLHNIYSTTAATPIVEEQEEDGAYSPNLERSTEAPTYNSVSSTPSSNIKYLIFPQRDQEYIYRRG